MAKLVPAKCPSCGATVVVDPDKDALTCEFCGNAFIVAKAITNYNTININEAKQDNEYTVQAKKEETKQKEIDDRSDSRDSALLLIFWVFLILGIIFVFGRYF